MIWQAVVESARSEPILVGGLVVGSGMLTVWGARTLLELRDHSRKVSIALFGDPDDPEPNGLKRDVRRLRGDLSDHITRQEDFNQGFTKAMAAHHDLLVPKLPPEKR